MKVLLTFDTGYAPHAATVMESIIQNCPEMLEFVVIYYDLNEEARAVLSNHFQGKILSLAFYEVDEQVLRDTIKDVKVASHLTGFNTYLRLFAPALLKEDSHIIYLDCDTIVQGNILDIVKDADLTKPLCAVREYDPKYKLRRLTNLNFYERPLVNPWIYEAYWHRVYRSLELSENSSYFNAGIQVINLKYWRVNAVGEKALLFIAEHPDKVFSADQDALNHVINGNFHALSPWWNTAVAYDAVFSNYPAKQLRQAVEHPCVIHIAGSCKPWHYMCDKKMQRLYWKYRVQTPWGKKEYKDRTMKNVLRKNIVLPLIKNVISLIKIILSVIFREEKAYEAATILGGDADFFANARLS